LAPAPLTPHIENVEEFLSHCHRRRYPAKSTIIYAGDQGDILYYIIKGSVTVMIEDDSDGKEIILAYLNPGDFFGEMGLFDQEHRSAWIRIKTECEVGEISYGKFIELSNKHPAFLFAISKQVEDSEIPREKSETWRFGMLLAEWRELYWTCVKNRMQIKITRQEIGRIIGCSREMVGRVLKELETQGLVSVSGKTMVVFGTR